MREAYSETESRLHSAMGILYTVAGLVKRTGAVYRHLLGQPLVNIRLELERLQDQLSERSPGALSVVANIRQEIEKIASLSDRFIASLPDFLSYGPIDVSSVVARSLSVYSVKRLAEERILIETDVADDADVVYASELLVEHIRNLLDNSLYAVRDALANGKIQEGRIVLRVRRTENLDRLRDPMGTELIEFRLTDNGTGVPEFFLCNIAVPGFTTKKDGSGFGLYAAKEYMSFLGGRFAYNNVPGRGFVVEFTLARYVTQKTTTRSSCGDSH